MTAAVCERCGHRNTPRRSTGLTFWYRCNRCNRLSNSAQIRSECFSCTTAAQAVWPDLGSVLGEVSGS